MSFLCVYVVFAYNYSLDLIVGPFRGSRHFRNYFIRVWTQENVEERFLASRFQRENMYLVKLPFASLSRHSYFSSWSQCVAAASQPVSLDCTTQLAKTLAFMSKCCDSTAYHRTPTLLIPRWENLYSCNNIKRLQCKDQKLYKRKI